MTEFRSPVAIAVALGGIFDDLKIAYYVGGSVASSIHGERRDTNDIDIVVGMRAEDLVPLVERLDAEFFVDAESMRDQLRRRGSWNIVEKASGIKIDLFFAGGDTFQRSMFARRVSLPVTEAGDTVYLASAEDMILRKLLWYREGGEVSERQWRDVVEMIRIAPIDLAYLNQWADWLDIVALLKKAQAVAVAPHRKGFLT